MPRRWTIEEMNKLSDIDFAIAVLQERKESCTNAYSPLMQKLEKAQNGLADIKRQQEITSNGIDITLYDEMIDYINDANVKFPSLTGNMDKTPFVHSITPLFHTNVRVIESDNILREGIEYLRVYTYNDKNGGDLSPARYLRRDRIQDDVYIIYRGTADEGRFWTTGKAYATEAEAENQIKY